MSHAYQIQSRQHWIYSSRLHVILYAMLLIATPFMFLQSFLVEGIATVTNSTVNLLGLPIKIVPISALALLVIFVIAYRSFISKKIIIAIALAILLDGLAQQITDYYFGHRFYDLQQNWHYLAYMLFAYVLYRDLAPRGLPIHRLILITYIIGVSLSALDETFQMHMSSRVFDIGDIAKDAWGTLSGIIPVYLGGKSSSLILKNKSLRHPKLRGYIRNPFSLMILIFLFSLIFLFYSSILTEFEYWAAAVGFTIGTFLLVFLVIHVSQFRPGRYALVVLFSIAILTQGFLFVRYRSQNIIKTQYGLTIYKGIPLPFFDFMIFPDGTFRPVDKKHYFNQRDREFFLKKKTDIILIGSGAYGMGGKGFPDSEHSFVYNPFIKRGTQIIIMKNQDACQLFNKLKRENKNVLFIIHGTC